MTKKEFCKKFNLSYSYVNSWGSIINSSEIKFPSWVFTYLKDILYFKIEVIKSKLSIEQIYEKITSGETLKKMYASPYSKEIPPKSTKKILLILLSKDSSD